MVGTASYTAVLQSLTIRSSAGGKRLYGQNVAIIGKFLRHDYMTFDQTHFHYFFNIGSGNREIGGHCPTNNYIWRAWTQTIPWPLYDKLLQFEGASNG